MKSAAISAAFSLVTALGEFCYPASKTYSSVPPSFAAPRYRNSSTENAGVAVITKAARIRKRTASEYQESFGPGRWPYSIPERLAGIPSPAASAACCPRSFGNAGSRGPTRPERAAGPGALCEHRLRRSYLTRSIVFRAGGGRSIPQSSLIARRISWRFSSRRRDDLEASSSLSYGRFGAHFPLHWDQLRPKLYLVEPI
jgi:hypothetical protein